MEETLIQLVQNLAHPRILVVGDLMLDRYVWGDANRISPEAPIPVLKVTHTEERLGGAAGVAHILHILEANVTLSGILGDDNAAQKCRELLDTAGIDSSLLITDATRRTTVKERFIGRAEQKYPQQVLRVDYEAEMAPTPSFSQAAVHKLRKQIREFDMVLVSDYNKGTCHPVLIRALIDECRSRKIRLLVDPGRNAEDLSVFRGCSTLTPNRREAGMAIGKALSDVSAAGAAAEQLRGSLELEVGLITLDRDGMVLADHQGWQHFPARPREVYDITGAGDVALAALGLVLACGQSYADAIRLANVAAGLSVESIGVTAVSRRDMINDLWRNSFSQTEKLAFKDRLSLELKRLRETGRKVIFTNGCFDLLHTGHVRLLREARKLGDLLVVGLNSDASMRSLGKGEGRPINDEASRAQVLCALECVDFVCIFDEDTPANLIQALRPDVLVKGADYRTKFVAGKDFVESYGGYMHFVDLTPERSTSGTIERIKNL